MVSTNNQCSGFRHIGICKGLDFFLSVVEPPSVFLSVLSVQSLKSLFCLVVLRIALLTGGINKHSSFFI